MSHYYKVVPALPACGGTQVWVRLEIDFQTEDVVEIPFGCICHTTLPPDAKVIGEYLDRPHRHDPMPLFDQEKLKQWKRRNSIRPLGLDAYNR